MHEHASYVYINDENTERWSTFEDHQNLITLLYLAASDKDTPCIDDYTFETRLAHFINELALIGRAHNWDKSRINANNQQEQYDDLEGDRPSCFSGVKRRLFQSVLGHLLLKLVTDELIKLEINEFAVKQFKEAINPNNRLALKKAWDKSIELEDLSDDEIKVVESLNISHEQHQNFKNYLSQKYSSSFSTNLSLIRLVDQAFELTPNSKPHLFKHGALMMEFFSTLPASENQVQSFPQNPNQFFGRPQEEISEDEPPSKRPRLS